MAKLNKCPSSIQSVRAPVDISFVSRRYGQGLVYKAPCKGYFPFSMIEIISIIMYIHIMQYLVDSIQLDCREWRALPQLPIGLYVYIFDIFLSPNGRAIIRKWEMANVLRYWISFVAKTLHWRANTYRKNWKTQLDVNSWYFPRILLSIPRIWTNLAFNHRDHGVLQCSWMYRVDEIKSKRTYKPKK